MSFPRTSSMALQLSPLMSERRRVTARPALQKKLVAVGDEDSGKTSLLVAFSTGRAPGNRSPKVFDNCVRDVQVDGQRVELCLWDTSGQERTDCLRPLGYHDMDVALLCFAIDSRQSFDSISEKWAPEIAQLHPQVPLILVGNNKDLRDQPAGRKKPWPVTQEEGRDMADSIGAFAYVESSAGTQDGVREVFETAARAALRGTQRLAGAECFFLCGLL